MFILKLSGIQYILFKFLEEVSLISAWSMVANSFRTLSLSLLRRVLVVDGGVEVVNRRVCLSIVGKNIIGAPKNRNKFLCTTNFLY